MERREPLLRHVVLPYPSRAGETVEMAYYEWEAGKPPPLGRGLGEGETNIDLKSLTPAFSQRERGILLCVHGLSRNGRDFDFLASALAPPYRVIAVDMPGRGESPWLPHKEDYTYDFYGKILGGFIDALNIKHCDWIGTSMGGILGMMLAAWRPELIGRLVLNDIGAVVGKEGLRRIARYLGTPLSFSSRAEAEAYMRVNYTSFGLQEEWQWQHVFAHSIMARTDGGFAFAYDPAIMDDTKKQTKNYTEFADVDLGTLWKLVPCPVLIVRGKDSDILTRATAEKMLERPQPTALYEVKGAGHAPSLMDEAQVDTIRKWLLSTPEAARSGWLSKARMWCIRKLSKYLVRR